MNVWQYVAELTPQIMMLRAEMVAAGETNSTGGPSCGVTSEELEGLLGPGFSRFVGAYLCDDGRAPEHVWVVWDDDGTIIDATGDHFGLPPVLVVDPDDPLAARYLDQDGDDF